MNLNKALFFDLSNSTINSFLSVEILDDLKLLQKKFLFFLIIRENCFVGSESENTRHIIEKLSSKGIRLEEIFCSADNFNESFSLFFDEFSKEGKLNLGRSYLIRDVKEKDQNSLMCCLKTIYISNRQALKFNSGLGAVGVKVLPDISSAIGWVKISEKIKSLYNDGELTDLIDVSAKTIKKGGTVILPTETVYGLGADATNPFAVSKVFEIKKRPANDPLIVHISDMLMLDRIADKVPDKVRLLAEHFWPGPLTFVLRKKALIPDIVTAGLPTVAVRMPMHPIIEKVIVESGCPISAPSANLFSQLSPTRFSDISDEILSCSDFAIDGGDCLCGIESTIVSFSDEENPVLLRAGSLAIERIEEIIGKVSRRSKNYISCESPGLQKKHYSPRTRLFLIKSPLEVPREIRAKSALLAFSKLSEEEKSGFAEVRILSEDCEFRKAASKFFSTLAELDNLGVEKIFAMQARESGLGIAINDRLRRAAVK